MNLVSADGQTLHDVVQMTGESQSNSLADIELARKLASQTKNSNIMKTRILTLSMISVLLVSLCLCVNAQKKSPTIEDLNKSNNRFMRLFNAGEIDSLSHLYVSHAFMIPGNSRGIQGREDIREYYRDLYSQGFRFVAIKPVAVVNGEDMYVERGTWSAVIDASIKLSGTYMAQAQLLNKQWLIVNEMSSTDAVEED